MKSNLRTKKILMLALAMQIGLAANTAQAQENRSNLELTKTAEVKVISNQEFAINFSKEIFSASLPIFANTEHFGIVEERNLLNEYKKLCEYEISYGESSNSWFSFRYKNADHTLNQSDFHVAYATCTTPTLTKENNSSQGLSLEENTDIYKYTGDVVYKVKTSNLLQFADNTKIYEYKLKFDFYRSVNNEEGVARERLRQLILTQTMSVIYGSGRLLFRDSFYKFAVLADSEPKVYRKILKAQSSSEINLLVDKYRNKIIEVNAFDSSGNFTSEGIINVYAFVCTPPNGSEADCYILHNDEKSVLERLDRISTESL